MTGTTFLSWTRLGITPDAAPEDPLSGALPGYGATTVGVMLNARPEIAVPARLYGPGDVTGLDARQVIRSYPAPGTDTAPAEFFPLVEFDRPDLPWLLTPARANAGERLRPWLVLVVVEAASASLGAEPGAQLPVLHCPLAELPDLADSWGWAHVQVSGDDLSSPGLATTLAGDPDRSLSRILCPRRLTPSTRYLAAVVPAFDNGRRRGLGLPVSEAEEERLLPAWSVSAGAGEVTLPVYHHWEFATAPGGDFITLASRLQARPLAQDLGLFRVDISNPGSGMPVLPQTAPGATRTMGGVLAGPLSKVQPWDPAAAKAFADALTPTLGARPDRFGPPLYGAAAARVDDGRAWPQWLRDLNLDPRHRIAAAYGADVVREHQEALVASAWAQSAAVRRANTVLRQGQLARAAAGQAHLVRLFGATGPGSDHVLQLTSPAHPQLSSAAGLAANPEVQAALTTAFRKATRPAGALARQLAPGGALPVPVTALGTRTLTVNPVLKPPSGMLPLERLVAGIRVADLSAALLKPFWWEGDPTGPNELPVQTSYRFVSVGAAMPARVFAVTDGGLLMSRTDAPVSWINHGTINGDWRARKVVGVPTAVRDLSAFVRLQDGTLASLDWNGDCWVWTDHGAPPGGRLTGDPLGLTRNSRPTSGGVSQTGEFDGVYVCAADGHLWERARRGDLWVWIDCGAPAVPVSGAPGGSGWQILVHGADQHLYRAAFDGSSWGWQDLSWPGVPMDPMVPAVAWNGGIARRSAAGAVCNVIEAPGFGPIWGSGIPTPHTITHLVGGSDLWALDTAGTASALRFRQEPGIPMPTTTSYGAAMGLAGPGIIRGGELWAAAGDHLVSTVSPPASLPMWRPLEVATSGGVGATWAAPPARPAWRSTVGLMSNLVVADADDPDGANAIRVRVGHDLGFDANVRGRWQLGPTPSGGHADHTQGLGLAVGRITKTIGKDVVAFWVEPRSLPTGTANVGVYQIGRNLLGDGTVAWDPTTFTVPAPFGTQTTSTGGLTAAFPTQGCDVALCDLDADDRPELVVGYVSGLGANPAVYYRIGWRLDDTGAVSSGWGDSVRVPWPGRTGEGSAGRPTKPPVQGVGVAVADVDGDLRPDLVVMIVEQTDAGLMASYMIGRQLNARGVVVGGWSGPFPVGPGPIGGSAQGASIAVADFTGTQQPDLLVMHLENLPTGNKVYYRVGFDLGASGQPRLWSAPREAHAGGTWGARSQGLGVAVTDLNDGLLDKRRRFADNFRTAAAAHLALIHRTVPGYGEGPTPTVDTGAISAALAGALDPQVTVTARVLGRLSGVDHATLPASADPLNPLAFAPTFPQPMSRPLLERHPDLLLPGTDGIPPDTISLLVPDPAFIEAFLAGLNHELSRELLWREFPCDRRATYARQFWDHGGADPAAGEIPDIPPIADWPAASALGSHTTGIGGPGMLLLAVRGELLRRFPDAQIFACQAAWDVHRPGHRVLTGQTMLPQFRHQLPPDTSLFGFPLDVASARGDVHNPGWFFILAEHPAALRFGVEPPPELNPVYAAAPGVWDDLDWARLVADAPALASARHVPLHPPFGSVSRPARAGGPALTWARNSAHLAHITTRSTVQLAVHARELIPDPAVAGSSPQPLSTPVVPRA